MIREFTIENFKSIESLTLPLGRVTVLIGENGAGKSNVLEAMSYFGAAAHNKLDSEFLFSRGIRVSPASQTLSAFDSSPKGWRSHSFCVSAVGKHTKSKSTLVICDSVKTGGEIEGWVVFGDLPPDHEVVQTIALDIKAAKALRKLSTSNISISHTPSGDRLIDLGAKLVSAFVKSDKIVYLEEKKGRMLIPSPFVVFSPENTALRTFEAEGQMRPLGVRGEGLFKLVQHLAEHQPAKFKLLRRELKLFDWFEDFAIPKRLGIGESRLEIKDRFLAAKRLLDQRSANEGFLFLLFYLCLFLSPQTPKFFAIDNIDASLNPKLCAEMMRRLVALAKQEDKQVIITTHNPAILDGLDLSDKEQMLYAIQRNDKGRTIAQRIPAPKPQPGEPALKLSHAYLRGLLGGVPKNF